MQDVKRYIFRRILLGIFVVWIVSVLIFVATRVTGDPSRLIAQPGASKEELHAIRERFGLDKPLPVQYFMFIRRAVKGDFGESLYYGVPVLVIMLEYLPATFELIIAATLISLFMGIPTGVLGALRRGERVDNLVKWFSFCGLAMPNFWIALVLIFIFSLNLKVLPTGGRGGIEHLVMPAVSLGFYYNAEYARITYSSLLEVLNTEYVRLARIKGLPETLVISKHGLKNALIPVVTFGGMNLVRMISGAVAIETVFAWPGLGLLMYEGAISRDFNLVQAVVLFMTMMMVAVNLLVDILYAYLDPRIRYK